MSDYLPQRVAKLNTIKSQEAEELKDYSYSPIKRYIVVIFTLAVVLWAMVWTLPVSAQQSEPQENSLQYQVDVKVSLVPFFVLDKKGNPVFDLKKEDLLLYVDGKPTDIYALMDYRFDTEEKKNVLKEGTSGPTTEASPAVKKALQQKVPQRVIFLIIDSIYNSHRGLSKSKRIAMEMVKRGGPGDRFIILTISLTGGVKYIAGPEPGSLQLAEKINALALLPGDTVAKDFLKGRAAEIAVIQFVESLAQLRYALKSITKPKILYLISEGIQRGSLYNNHFEESELVRHFKDGGFFDKQRYSRNVPEHMEFYFKDFLKAINYGGCVLNVIYPGLKHKFRDAASNNMISVDEIAAQSNDTEWVLKYVSIASGGAYFYAPNVDRMVSTIQKSSTAYYELVFSGNTNDKTTHRVVVKCRNKNYAVHTLNYTEAEKEYKDMELTQKKVFAISVATGGSWSRMVGRIVQSDYEKIQTDKRNNNNHYKIRVPIPDKLKNKKADIFLMRFDKKYQDTSIAFMSKTLAETEELEIQSKKGKKNLYFVIIDPETTYTIYNHVK
jgi:VWFA-related protein